MRAVDVRVKRGRHHNELTRYHYDVVLSTAEPVADLRTAPVLRWGRDVPGALEAGHRVAAERPAVLRLAGIPNRRVHDEYTAMQSLFDPRESIDLAPRDAPAPGPEELCRAAERLGYRALPTWGESPDLLDIVLVDPGQVPAGALTGVYAAPVTDAGSRADVPPARAMTLDALHDHLQDLPSRHTAPSGPMTLDALHDHLQDLPSQHTAPSGPMTLDALHDHLQDLPSRHTAPYEPTPHGTQPGTPVQEILRDLFAEVLGLPRHEVHAGSDFFRIGGDARAAARLLSRVRTALGADPGDRALHDAPTPAAFAALVGDGRAAVTGPRGAAGDSVEFSLRLRGVLDTDVLAAALRTSAVATRRCATHGSAGPAPGCARSPPTTTCWNWPCPPTRSTCGRPSRWPPSSPGPTVHGPPGEPRTAPPPHWTLRPARSSATCRPPRCRAAPDSPATPPTAPWRPSSTPDFTHGSARLATEHGTTLFMVVHAALAALLNRLGAPGPITVAAPVPARDTAGLRDAVGPHGRVLALTVDTAGDPAFTELLRRVREEDLAAYLNGEAALAALPGGIALTVLQEGAHRFEAAGLTVRAEHRTLPSPPRTSP